MRKRGSASGTGVGSPVPPEVLGRPTHSERTGGMATSAAEGFRAPRRWMLWGFAAIGVAAGPGIFALALAADGAVDPVVHASLAAWSTVPYVLCAVIAWSRRPASAFGPLMVAAGLVGAASTLDMSNVALLANVGSSLDLLPPVLFVHVFLAFPTGRLDRRLDGPLVAAGYVVAFGGTVVSEAGAVCVLRCSPV